MQNGTTYYLFYVANFDMPSEPEDYYAAAISETDPWLHVYFAHFVCYGESVIKED